MAPHVGKTAFAIGIFVIVLSLVILPFLEPGSPQFIVTLITLAIISVWLGFIVWSIRRETAVPRMKPDKDRPADAKEAVNEIKKQTVHDKEGVVK